MTQFMWFPNGAFPLGWEPYLFGGLCLGAGVALLFVLTGLIGGMSSVYSTTWSWFVHRPFFQRSSLTGSRVWRVAHAGGLIIGAAAWLSPSWPISSGWAPGATSWAGRSRGLPSGRWGRG